MKKVSDKVVLRNILKNIKEQSQISKAVSDPDEYNNIVDEFGITDELNQIIDNFEDTEVVQQPSLYNKVDRTIGIICDEFLYYSLKDTANFVYIPYTEQINVNTNLDLLLVVSSWRGLDHSWDYVANPNGSKREELIELIQAYKNNDVPTIFYSKEDPISYKEYLSLAQECDYIFTSAKESVEKYKQDTNNENVDFLEFGVNPLYHNPIGKDLSNKYLNRKVTFAGSWMVRFPERNNDALNIFEGVNKTNYELCIIDRQYEREMKRYHFPPYLIKNISATVPHERLMKLHKATSWGINLNSVKDSSTMFANRVYELQAMGNVVISNFNPGVHKNFPNILLANNSKDVEVLLNNIDLKEQKKLIARGISEVMLNHTSYHRMAKILTNMGIDYTVENPKVLVVGNGENAKNSFDNQLYKDIQFMDYEEFDTSSTQFKASDYITFFSNNINYEEYYITNLLSAFAYTNADVVYMNKDKYTYTGRSEFIKSTSMMKAPSFLKYEENDTELVFFNIPKTEVTSKRNTPAETNTKKLLTVVIPVRQDYKFLENKSIFSINQNGLKESVHILLVDNGNDEIEKDKILNRLTHKHNNIEICKQKNETSRDFPDVNEILDSVPTKYLMFLSAENQVSQNTMKYFLNHLNESNIQDMVYGNSERAFKKDKKSVNTNSRNLQDLIGINTSLEAMIFNKSFLKNSEFSFDDKDLFVIDVLERSKNKVKIDKVLQYSYTEKSYDYSSLIQLNHTLLLEKKRKEILDEEGLLEEYVDEIFIPNFLDHYIEHFRTSEKQDKIKALAILEELFEIYSSYYYGQDKKLNQILDLLLGYNFK